MDISSENCESETLVSINNDYYLVSILENPAALIVDGIEIKCNTPVMHKLTKVCN